MRMAVRDVRYTRRRWRFQRDTGWRVTNHHQAASIELVSVTFTVYFRHDILVVVISVEINQVSLLNSAADVIHCRLAS